jgi:putative membrane protein
VLIGRSWIEGRTQYSGAAQAKELAAMMRGYGYGYGPAGGDGWIGAIVMMGFWLLILVGVILLVVWAVRSMSGGHGQASSHAMPPMGMHTPTHDEAMALLRKRFAAGEIDATQFEEMKKALG